MQLNKNNLLCATGAYYISQTPEFEDAVYSYDMITNNNFLPDFDLSHTTVLYPTGFVEDMGSFVSKFPQPGLGTSLLEFGYLGGARNIISSIFLV